MEGFYCIFFAVVAFGMFLFQPIMSIVAGLYGVREQKRHLQKYKELEEKYEKNETNREMYGQLRIAIYKAKNFYELGANPLINPGLTQKMIDSMYFFDYDELHQDHRLSDKSRQYLEQFKVYIADLEERAKDDPSLAPWLLEKNG